MAMSPETLKDRLVNLGRSDILDVQLKNGDVTIIAQTDKIVELVTFLRDDQRFRFIQLIDICGADYPSRIERFEVVYHLLSFHKNCRLRVKVTTDETKAVPSLVDVFPAAEWNEREAFDMYGISFGGHPDLRRILTDYGFTGYPLRKDFPLTGYVELRYDDERKRVVYEPVRLTQDYRSFDFLSPWEGMQKDLPGDEKATERQGS
ncbi:MAG: NADH-quinone oxidoreductase subunit C [Pseudomonadota bacterium]